MIEVAEGSSDLGCRGATLIELIIVLVVSAFLMAGAVSLFLVFERVAEEQAEIRDAQAELHRSVELLVRLVRNASEIEEASSEARLAVSGGRSMLLCGNPTCWIEATEEGLLSRPPEGEEGVTRVIAPAISEFELRFGLDSDGDGVVDSFSPDVPSEAASNVLAVAFRLAFDASRTRGRFQGELGVTAVVREKVFERLEIGG